MIPWKDLSQLANDTTNAETKYEPRPEGRGSYSFMSFMPVGTHAS
jgi:hypothetical protein